MEKRRESDRRISRPDRPSAHVYRQEVARRGRQAHAVQIRKQKKEERLSQRRQMQTTTNNGMTPDDLLGFLNQYLAQVEHRTPLETQGNLLKQLQAGMSASKDCTNVFLERLLEQEETKARDLISALLHNIRAQPNTHKIYLSSLGILIDLASLTATREKPAAADDYYGNTPTSWSDLLSEETALKTTLLQQVTAATTTTPTNHLPPVVRASLGSVLGNILKHDASARQLVLDNWALVVQQLPMSSFLCAALIRHDISHAGRDFLRDLTPRRIADLLLLQSSSSLSCRDAAWILEGLSRREVEAIKILCRDRELVDAWIVSMCRTVAEDTPSDTKGLFLHPAFRAVGNVVAGSNGEFAEPFLSSEKFLSMFSTALQRGLTVEAAKLAGCFLLHVDVAPEVAETFVPRLVDILVFPSAVYEWKMEAAWSIYMSCLDDEPPPDQVGPQARRNDFVQLFLWIKVPEQQRQAVLQSLVELLSSEDMDAVTASVTIIDRILRVVPGSCTVFASIDGGIECLETLCVRGGDSSELEMAASLAADLLDDFFEDEEDSSQGDIAGIEPAAKGDQLVFGQQVSSNAAFDFGNASVPSSGRGRGRGMTLPAWMSK